MSTVAVDEVIVPSGRRFVEPAKVQNLVESIEEVGLLQPIIVTPERRLVAGAHRLAAFKQLGRNEIPVNFKRYDEIEAELAEIDENLVRAELTAAQRAKLTARRKTLYLAKHPETGHGKATSTSESDDKKDLNLRSLSFTEDTAKRSGKGRSTVARDVTRGEKVSGEILEELTGSEFDTGSNLDELAKLEPKRQREVVEFAKKQGTSNLKLAQRNLKRSEAIKSIESEPQPLPTGPFRVISADPPWTYEKRDEDASHRGTTEYKCMSIKDICDLDVGAVAHEDCILWLWTTNAHMHEAYHVIDAWGFTPKTILTWVKNKMGLGDWLRGKTEHCILAVRGRPVVNLTNQTTELKGDVREHSRKPIEFYELVEKLCPGSKLEMFCRENREGWTVWGSETEKFNGDS